MSARALERRGREAREWLMEACFPLWSDRGTQGCGFLEALDLQHRPIGHNSARVRVQARQTYVFAAAHALGWSPGRASDLVQLGLGALETACRRPDGLFGRRLDLASGALSDDVGDLYDTAFGLYALASVCQLALRTGQDQLAIRARALIDQTGQALETHMAHPSGGYAESVPRSRDEAIHRMQNPHMHLFEASLLLANVTGDAAHRARAEALHALCLNYFIDIKTGTLGEYFLTPDWQVPEGPKGDVIEPGHQFEWVWLLSEYARLSGQPLPDQARGLYRFACQTLDGEGRAMQSCLRDGTPVDASRRTWPQTEALKAHMAMWRAGDETASARAVASFDALMDDYLTPEGGWIDHFDQDGQVRSVNMPASTGYHVVLALLDLIGTVQA